MNSASILLIAAIAGQPADLPPFIQMHMKTMSFYYKSPEPTLGPKMLKDFLKAENFDHAWYKNKSHVVELIAGQLGDIALGQAKIVREYEAQFAENPAAGQRLILQALTTCGDKETIKQIDLWLKDTKYTEVKPDLENLKKHLENPKRTHPRDQVPKQPKEIDRLWANFFITGEYAPVSRILDIFDLPDAKENEVLKRVGKWSLGSNLQQHPKLVELIRKHTNERPEGSKKVINELILIAPKP